MIWLCLLLASSDDDFALLKADKVNTATLVPQLLETLAASTGLSVKRPVAVHEEDRGGLAAMLRKLVARQYPNGRLDQMGKAFRAIQLLPADSNLREEAIALYAGQVSGYYDPYTARLVLLRDVDPTQRMQVLQHELTHALQDQNYGLERLLDRAIADEDTAAALQGAIEGQAVVAMFSGPPRDEAEEKRALKELVADGVLSDKDAAALGQMAKESGGESLAGLLQPAISPQTSAYLHAQLTFPYQEGTRFIETLSRKTSLSDAVRKTLSKPPVSTKQVLYPQVYLDGEQPLDVRGAKLHTIPNWPVTFETTVGALNIRTLLGGASELPAHWRGDRVFLLERGSAFAAAWITQWDSPAAATAFAAAYTAVVAKSCQKAGDERYVCRGKLSEVRRFGRAVAFCGELEAADLPLCRFASAKDVSE